MSAPSRKNVRFSGKEQRKPREVRAPRVDLGFGEVGVDRHRRQHVRAEPLRHVEARLELAVDVGADGAGMPPPVVTAGRTLSPSPRSKSGRSGQQPGAAGLRHLILARRRRPAIGFEQALDAALHVEVPLVQPGLEAQGLERESRSRRSIPSARRAVAASQMPSQSALSLSPPGLIRPS